MAFLDDASVVRDLHFDGSVKVVDTSDAVNHTLIIQGVAVRVACAVGAGVGPFDYFQVVVGRRPSKDNDPI